MGALSSFPHAIRGVVRNPLLVVVAAIYGLVALPQLLAQTLGPILSTVVSLAMIPVFILLVPFYQGGIVGMANRGYDGPVSIGTFVEEGKSNFVSLLAAYVVFMGLAFVIGFALVIGFAVLAAFVLASGGDNTMGWLVIGGVFLLVLLVYFLIVFFIQFYVHAIVIDDRDLVEGFKRSVGLVRSNIVSVLGYSLISFVGGGVLGLVGVGASLVFLPQNQQTMTALPEPTPALMAGAAVLYLVATAIGGAFWAAYSVSYYRDISPTAGA